MIVEFSTALRRFVDNKEKIDVDVSMLSELFESLTDSYPELVETVFTKELKLMNFVTLFVNDRNIPDTSKDIDLPSNATVSFVSSFAGG